MRLFKKRVRQEQVGFAAILAEKITAGILTRQRKWAYYLNRKASKLSFKSRCFALFAFCLISGSYLVFLLVSSIL
ncbi:hypothetical protein [Pedobacter nyackensis]|uniref:hypothetical protein n=1 Tax=Pedobacter nyackensis TaxID=475255 RepID=UPI00293098A3|nr:hypothetical protein [Pedobacter nyackensis]